MLRLGREKAHRNRIRRARKVLSLSDLEGVAVNRGRHDMQRRILLDGDVVDDDLRTQPQPTWVAVENLGNFALVALERDSAFFEKVNVPKGSVRPIDLPESSRFIVGVALGVAAFFEGREGIRPRRFRLRSMQRRRRRRLPALGRRRGRGAGALLSSPASRRRRRSSIFAPRSSEGRKLFGERRLREVHEILDRRSRCGELRLEWICDGGRCVQALEADEKEDLRAGVGGGSQVGLRLERSVGSEVLVHDRPDATSGVDRIIRGEKK